MNVILIEFWGGCKTGRMVMQERAKMVHRISSDTTGNGSSGRLCRVSADHLARLLR